MEKEQPQQGFENDASATFTGEIGGILQVTARWHY